MVAWVRSSDICIFFLSEEMAKWRLDHMRKNGMIISVCDRSVISCTGGGFIRPNIVIYIYIYIYIAYISGAILETKVIQGLS